MARNFFVDESDDLRWGRVGLICVAAIFGLFLFWGSFVVIGAEEVGIPVTLGKVGKRPSYGFTTKLPFVTSYVRFEKTTQRMTLQDASYTKDIQPSNFEYVFTYSIVPDNATELYLAAGRAYEYKLVEPKLHAALKDIIGRYTATELVANREKAASEVEARLREELSSKYFTDISVSFNDIDYSDEFEAGITAKVLAEQEAQKAKNKTVQIEEEARQRVIKAQGDADAQVAEARGKAEAMDIEGAAIRRNSQYLDLKKLDVQLKMAESAKSWSTVIMSSSQASNLLNIPSK